MAKKIAAWGIDIGQFALKALRCRAADDGTERIIADAFDFIEYPKPLSSPDADPVALIKDALKQFLSRNKLKGDQVVVSVSGQSGLARFIKLPPVESKKIPDIVRYEAKQQIPFPLEEVVWDYQQMGAGAVEEGFALDCEVGIFAIKRDQVDRALRPFVDADVEVDVVQLTPLALFNWVSFDQLRDLPKPEEYDPENPPESTVVLSLGTETTDFVVTNGFKMWQRSLPVGGSHFTKALVKETKMNYQTAEHLKRNASKAEDPKALFQAMRPVFSDLLAEVEKSLKFYSNMDRAAKIGRIVALGNAVKLPGLQKFLSQNLGFDVVKLDAYRSLTGPGVVDAPAFKENMLSYGVCYGLALQGLNKAKVRTNLLPRDILQYRFIRAKKPWAIAGAALLLLGLTFNYMRHHAAMTTAAQGEPGGNGFRDPVGQSQGVAGDAQRFRNEFETAKQEFRRTYQIGDTFVKNIDGRALWIEVLRSVNACLPRNPADRPPTDINSREDVKITALECRYVPDLAAWYAGIEPKYAGGLIALGHKKPDAADSADESASAPAQPGAAARPAASPGGVSEADLWTGPTGPGWVFEFRAHHYFNDRQNDQNQGMNYLYRTLLKNLLQREIEIPDEVLKKLVADDEPLLSRLKSKGPATSFPVRSIGIKNPVLIDLGAINWNYMVDADDPSRPGQRIKIPAPRFDFVLQFCWQEVLPDRGTPLPDATTTAGGGQ